MRKRLATRGPNAGNHFWGCLAYPNCNGIVNMDGQGNASGEGAETFVSGADLPRPLTAEGLSPEHRAIYLDTAVLPRWLVKAVARADSNPLAKYAWRIDLPTTEPAQEHYHPGVDSTYAFLLRGGVTAASSRLLTECQLEFAPARDTVQDYLGSLPPHFLQGRTAAYSERVFDSTEERQFFDAFRQAAERRGLLVSITPQVGFQSLAPSSELADAGFRVDFVASAAEGQDIVVEIDGAQHAAEAANDERRDAALRQAGFEVIRIAAAEVRRDAAGTAKRVLEQLGAEQRDPLDPNLAMLQRLAQLQIAVVATMRAGLMPSVGDASVRVAFADGTDALADTAIQSALDDLSELIRDMALARGATAPELSIRLRDTSDATVFQFGSGAARPERSTIYIHDILRFAPPLIELGAADAPSGDAIDREATQRVFVRCYGFPDFRPGQFEAVERAIRGLDTLLLLPTGAGKSATYQFATLIRGGVCIVVDPLLSLIDDQIQNLREHGVDRSAQVSSQIDAKQRETLVTLLCQGHMSFVFVSPERLQQVSFREAIQVVALRRGIALIAIDEAHCVSQWGHDFRPAYLNVAKTIRSHSKRSSGIAPPVLAMTGTASYAVLRDIQREVGITDPDAQITPNDFDRRELRFEVVPCRTPDKGAELAKVLVGLSKRFKVRDPASFWNRRKESPITGLVFCPHVDGPHGTVHVANAVQRALPTVTVATHSGKPPKGTPPSTWNSTKRQAAAQFKRDDVQILACTNSFGMGIDKPNIRFTVHWGLPQSIESYYQEAGRAGRGRMESWCVLLVSDDNPALADQQLVGRGPTAEPPFNSQSDIDRQLWFHRKSFPDQSIELAQLQEFVDRCMTSLQQVVDISFTGDADKQIRERAVYRLLLIGVARDYTVDWRTGNFQVHLAEHDSAAIIACFANYVSAFNAKRGRALRAELEKWCSEHNATPLETARHAGEQLIHFTYDQIEGTRRRALSEMRRVAREHAGDEPAFRHALLAYLSTSAFSSMLQAIADDAGGGLELIPEILDRIESPLDAADLASQAARLLGAIYDHPGLLTIRAAALLASTNPDSSAASQDIALATESAAKFELDPSAILDALDAAMSRLEIDESRQAELTRKLTRLEADPARGRRHAELLAHSKHPTLAGGGLAYLTTGVLRGTDHLLETLKHVV
jgi:ATP-dependent DNA helicase RecQ